MPLISLVFSVRIVNYGSSFCSIDLWPKREKIDGKKRGSAIYKDVYYMASSCFGDRKQVQDARFDSHLTVI